MDKSVSSQFIRPPSLRGKETRIFSWSDKIKCMVKERRLWLIVRKLEKTKAPGTVVLEEQVVIEALSSGNFKDLQEVSRVLDSLKKDGHLTSSATYIGPHTWTSMLITNPASDKHFYLAYWWPKVVDAVGFWKIWATIMGALAVITAVVTLLLK